MVQSLPVRTQQWTSDISGINTDFLALLYADRLMIVATQVGALGTIQSAKYVPLCCPDVVTTVPALQVVVMHMAWCAGMPFVLTGMIPFMRACNRMAEVVFEG
jgi:hypothetical protein